MQVASRGSDTHQANWFSSLALQKVRVLYLYGLGTGYLPDAFSWLSHTDDRYLVLIDTCPLSIQYWKSQHAWFFDHPRVKVTLASKESLIQIAAYTCMVPYAFVSLPGRESEAKIWESQLRDARMTQDSIACKLLDLNTHFYPHFYYNLRNLPGSFHAAKLYGRFRGMPAIICGAGPSLDRALPQLRALSDRALIIGCGSALTALTRKEFRPHLGAGFCSTTEEIHRFWHASAFDIPIVYRMRLNAEAAAFMTGPRLYTNGSCGLEVVRWAEEALGLEAEEIQEGPSIIYLTTDLVHKLGCDPIVYVGMDLAYTGEQCYAAGVGAVDRPADVFIHQPDIATGKPVRTKWSWVCEANLLRVLIETHSDTRHINATGGGIGIPGVPNESLSAISESWRKRDLAGELHAALATAQTQVSVEQTEALLGELRSSIGRCIQHLEVLVGQPPAGLEALHEVELREELAFQVIFDQMLTLRRYYLARFYDHCPSESARKQEQYRYLLNEAIRNRTLLGP